MKFIAISGSPLKKHHAAILLDHTFDGARLIMEAQV